MGCRPTEWKQTREAATFVRIENWDKVAVQTNASLPVTYYRALRAQPTGR